MFNKIVSYQIYLLPVLCFFSSNAVRFTVDASSVTQWACKWAIPPNTTWQITVKNDLVHVFASKKFYISVFLV